MWLYKYHPLTLLPSLLGKKYLTSNIAKSRVFCGKRFNSSAATTSETLVRYSSLPADLNHPDHDQKVQSSNVRPSHFMENIVKRCYGCASPFHEHEPNTPGYNPFEAEKKSKAKKLITSVKVEKDQKVNELFDSLDEDKKEFLLNEGTVNEGLGTPQSVDPSGPSLALSKAQQKIEKRSKLSKIFCKWCRDSINSKELRLLPPIKDRQELLDLIPKEATIIHLFDAMDFPTTVDFGLVEMMKRRKGRVLWVMNRSDLIMPDKERTEGRLLKYVRSELYRMAGIKPENVFAISSNYNWFADELFSQLSEDNYLVGHTNTGKSTLALYLSHKFRQSGNGRKYWGLGSWSNPFITQQPTTYLLQGNKYLTDLPSYPEDATNYVPPIRRDDKAYEDKLNRFDHIPHHDLIHLAQIDSTPTPVTTTKGVYDLIKPSLVRKLTNGHRLFRTPGIYNSPQRVVSTLPNQFISIGGLVAIKRVDSPIHLITWSIYPDSNYKTRVVSSLEKVTEFNQSSLKTHERWTMVKPENASQPLTKKMEFKFGGEGVSLAIRGVGLIHIHGYGRIPEDGVTMEVYAMDDVKIMRRRDILPYIRNPRNLLKEKRDETRERAENKKAAEVREKRRQRKNLLFERRTAVDAYLDR